MQACQMLRCAVRWRRFSLEWQTSRPGDADALSGCTAGGAVIHRTCMVPSRVNC